MATKSTFRENFLRVIAVIGLIAILLLGAWGIIQLAFYLPTFFANFGKAKEAITLTLPAQSTSDKPITVSWKHTAKQDVEYSYSVQYSCANGLQFAAPVPTGAYQLIPCNTPFNFVNASSSMQVIPVLASGTAKATTTVTVAATKLSDGVIAVKGTAMTTVSASTTQVSTSGTSGTATGGTGSTYNPGSTNTTPAKPAATTPAKPASKPASTYYASGRTTNLYGAPDLLVQITSAPQQAQAGSRVSLQFVVTNVGTNVAAAGWSFVATLPYNPVYVYPSGGQQALYPGDRIVYTLGYDAVPTNGGYYGGQSQATIQVDAANYVPESNEQNNVASASYQVY